MMDDIEPIAGYPNKRTMLEELYGREGLSIRAISVRLGIGTATVERWMRMLEIPRRTRGGANTPAVLGWKMHHIDPRLIFSLPTRKLANLLGISESYIFKFRRGATATWNSPSFPPQAVSNDTQP